MRKYVPIGAKFTKETLVRTFTYDNRYADHTVLAAIRNLTWDGLSLADLEHKILEKVDRQGKELKRTRS
jgi:hypothetical protein